MRQDYLKGAASFMIALILTLPFYSSAVLASLSNGNIYGDTDEIQGYVRKNENVKLEVTAYLREDLDISPSQLHITNLQGPIFSECTEKPNGAFLCTHEMSSSLIRENPSSLRIQLYDDNEIFDSAHTINVAFDELAPEIKQFTITPNLISSGNINFNYNVQDHAYSQTDIKKCSGIDKIELSYQDVVFHSENITSTSNDCSRSGTTRVPISSISNLEEGTIEVIMTAYDNFGQTSTQAAQFEYDTQAVDIDSNSLEVKDNSGRSVDFIGDNEVTGTISFVVISEDLDTNNVYGDISRINTNSIPSYSNKKASCTSYETGYTCQFTNVDINLDESSAGSIPITIKAQDKAGNMEPYVITRSIIYDTTGASTSTIRTDKADGNTYYAGSSTTFIAELEESGVGIDKNTISLDLSEIRSGLVKTADECTKSNNRYTCYWNNIIADRSNGEKTVSISGTDLLGNPLTGTSSSTIILDKTPPQLISAEVQHVGVGVEAIEGYIKTGDSLDVTLTIREEGDLRAYTDFSYFVTTEDNESTSCIADGDIWTCEIRSSQIDIPGHRTGNLIFNLVDTAGNQIRYTKPLEVLEYEDATDVSYWTSKVTCSPTMVDRQITDLVNTRVYCGIELSTTGITDQETLSINFNRGDCTDDYNNSLNYIENIDVVNKERGSIEPYLAIDLIKGEMSIDRLSFTCPIKIVSRVEDRINQNPEIEPIEIDINFYNMPLGEYGQGIEDRIEDAKDDANEGIWKIIGFLKKIFKWAKLICNALATIQKVKRILQVISGKFTTAHMSSVGPPQEPILAAAKTGSCAGDKAMGEIAKTSYAMGGDKICKWINCQTSPTAPGTDKGGGAKEKSEWAEISDSIGKGHWFDSYMDWPISLPTGGEGNRWASGTISEVTGKHYYQYANSRDNFFVALVTGCIPGMINGLEKLRQIKCLYADCLEQNWYNSPIDAQRGVPPDACEKLKKYQECKYFYGEIFALLPYSALLDYYANMIRSAFSDPISAIVNVYNVWKKPCTPICDPSKEASAQWLKNEGACRFLQFFSLLGEVIADVEGIIDDYEQIKQDYCKRID